MKPEDLLFAKTHEWCHLDKASKTATVGISAHALEALTDLVYVELPKVGRQVKAGESFGEIESVKAVSDIYAPVSGEVVEVHSGIADKLETLGSDPYGEGWLVKLKITGDEGAANLLSHKAYQDQVASEEH